MPIEPPFICSMRSTSDVKAGSHHVEGITVFWFRLPINNGTFNTPGIVPDATQILKRIS